MQEHYDKLRRMYLAAPCNQGYAALDMQISEGQARVEFRTGSNPYKGIRNRLTPRQASRKRRLMKHVKK